MIDGQGEVKSWETKGSGANRKVPATLRARQLTAE
jgi:hypothetical protein